MPHVRGGPCGLGNENVVTASAESRHEGDGHAGERVVHNKWGSLGLEEISGEKGASTLPVGVSGGVLRAVAADEIVAEGQLGMPRVRILDDVGVEGD